MSVRVGTCVCKGSKRSDPSFPNFIPIIVLMKSHSKWGEMGPYLLKDEKGRILENVWQFSKIYLETRQTKERYSQFTKQVIWEQDKEVHAIEQDEKEKEEKKDTDSFVLEEKTYRVTPEYKMWRKRGKNNEYAVRYPNGYHGRGHVLTALMKDMSGCWRSLSYVQARKAIYAPLYCRLVRKTKKFKMLQKMLREGKNLLIIEVDGPKDPKYFSETYGRDDIIQDGTMLVTKENIDIMLNEPKYAFGHGYCLACALLDKEEWLLDDNIFSKYQQEFLRERYEYDGPYLLSPNGYVSVFVEEEEDEGEKEKES
jgi:hypothetical protein